MKVTIPDRASSAPLPGGASSTPLPRGASSAPLLGSAPPSPLLGGAPDNEPDTPTDHRADEVNDLRGAIGEIVPNPFVGPNAEPSGPGNRPKENPIGERMNGDVPLKPGIVDIKPEGSASSSAKTVSGSDPFL